MDSVKSAENMYGYGQQRNFRYGWRAGFPGNNGTETGMNPARFLDGADANSTTGFNRFMPTEA